MWRLILVLCVASASFPKLLKEKGAGAELVGSFTAVIGEQDEAGNIGERACA